MLSVLPLSSKAVEKYPIIWRYIFVCALSERTNIFFIYERLKKNLIIILGDLENILYLKGKIVHARSVMVTVLRNGHSDTSSNLDKAVCISHSTNTLRKGMNPIIFPPVMDE